MIWGYGRLIYKEHYSLKGHGHTYTVHLTKSVSTPVLGEFLWKPVPRLVTQGQVQARSSQPGAPTERRIANEPKEPVRLTHLAQPGLS